MTKINNDVLLDVYIKGRFPYWIQIKWNEPINSTRIQIEHVFFPFFRLLFPYLFFYFFYTFFELGCVGVTGLVICDFCDYLWRCDAGLWSTNCTWFYWTCFVVSKRIRKDSKDLKGFVSKGRDVSSRLIFCIIIIWVLQAVSGTQCSCTFPCFFYNNF